MKDRMKILVICILCLCVLLTGCIGNNKNSDKDAYGTASPKVKGTLNLSSYTPDTLNPLATQYSCVRDFLYLSYEGLFVVNEDLGVTGVLADSYKLSGGNTSLRINLKKGVKFHDGSAFTSKDVIATFDYIKLYSDYYKDALKGVSSYKADGDYAVVITLSEPNSNFVCNLDFPILPSGISEGQFKSADFNINGTGRYKYKETNPYVSIILTKNTSWHKKDNVYIPTVNIRFVNNNEAMLHAFDSGETDMITTERARWGEFSYTGNFKTYEITTTKYMFVGINTKSSVFSDVKLRQSLSSVVDREAMGDTIMFSHAASSDTPITPKAHFYRNDKTEDTKYDAKPLKDKGIEKLFILYNEDDKTKASLAEAIRRALEEEGIKAELSSVDYDTYISKIASGDYQLYIGKVDVKRDCDLGFMFGRMSSQSEDGGNLIYNSSISDFADTKLTDIIDNINSAKDEEALKLSYNNLKLFYEVNYPQIPLFHMNDAIFVNGRIKGVLKPNLTNFYADIGGIYIE